MVDYINNQNTGVSTRIEDNKTPVFYWCFLLLIFKNMISKYAISVVEYYYHNLRYIYTLYVKKI